MYAIIFVLIFIIIIIICTAEMYIIYERLKSQYNYNILLYIIIILLVNNII